MMCLDIVSFMFLKHLGSVGVQSSSNLEKVIILKNIFATYIFSLLSHSP